MLPLVGVGNKMGVVGVGNTSMVAPSLVNSHNHMNSLGAYNRELPDNFVCSMGSKPNVSRSS